MQLRHARRQIGEGLVDFLDGAGDDDAADGPSGFMFLAIASSEGFGVGIVLQDEPGPDRHAGTENRFIASVDEEGRAILLAGHSAPVS